MKCHLIVKLLEITVRGYSHVEEEGILSLLKVYPKLSPTYEADEEDRPWLVLVIKAKNVEELLEFLHFTDIPVQIIL